MLANESAAVHMFAFAMNYGGAIAEKRSTIDGQRSKKCHAGDVMRWKETLLANRADGRPLDDKLARVCFAFVERMIENDESGSRCFEMVLPTTLVWR